MSIYSGFATRHQEECYDGYTGKMLVLLQKMVCELLGGEKPANRYCEAFERIYGGMKRMEEAKYLKPKLTECLGPLVKLCFDQEFGKGEVEISAIRINVECEFEKRKVKFTPSKGLVVDFGNQSHDKSISFSANKSFTTRRSTVPNKSKSSVSNPKSLEHPRERKADNYSIFRKTHREVERRPRFLFNKEKGRQNKSIGEINVSRTVRY